MPQFKFTQPIHQLEKRKGGYFYFQIDAPVVEQFPKKKRFVSLVLSKAAFPTLVGWAIWAALTFLSSFL